jgi:hypothetical protein
MLLFYSETPTYSILSRSVQDPKKIRPLKGATVSPGVAGADMHIGDLVQNDSNNEAQLASSGAVGQIGMVVGRGQALALTDGSVNVGDGITICWRGRIAIGDALLDPTAAYFQGATPGKLDDTADVTVRRVGGAEASSILALDGTHVD